MSDLTNAAQCDPEVCQFFWSHALTACQRFGERDRRFAQAIAPTTDGVALTVLARIIANTDWEEMDPDETIALIDFLRDTSRELLGSLEVRADLAGVRSCANHFDRDPACNECTTANDAIEVKS